MIAVILGNAGYALIFRAFGWRKMAASAWVWVAIYSIAQIIGAL